MTMTSMVGMGANAASTTRTIDNDSIATGYGNENTGFSYINGITSLVNGDGRYSSGSSSNEYKWTYPTISTGTYTQYADVTIEAYLAYSSWTDTTAKYYVNYAAFADCPVGTINQNKAPNGYSSITAEDVETLSAVGGHVSSYARIKPSGNRGETTGADEIKVTLSY